MKSPHDFMIDIATSALGYSVRQPLGRITLAEEQPPSRNQRAYDDAYWAVLEGKNCAFYPTNEWRGALDSPVFDNEQEIALFNAVKLAASLISASDGERWAVVMNALRAEAEKFAKYAASEV
jgi:hypothetical protein